MLRLVIEDDEGTTHVVPLIRDEITIGRKEGNTIRLTERNVSRRHARLVRAGEHGDPTVLVEDLDSYNGIKLNGDRVSSKCIMRPGDLIQIGDYSLALRVDEPAGKDGDRDTVVAAPEGLDAVATAVHRVEDEELSEAQRGRLVVVSSNLAGTTYTLERREVIIGRTDENDVVINHRSISRNHAKIIYRDSSFTIIDLASSNGVKVNGDDFGTATLVNGDIIELGHVKLRYLAPGDDYVFTPADIEDVELSGGPSTGKLVLIALLLVAVAAGTFLAVGKMMTRKEAPAPAPEPAPVAEPQGKVAPKVDMTALLAEADGLLKEEKWSEASKVYSRALQEEPEQVAPLEGRKRATAEAGNERKYQELLKDADQAQWHDAFFALEDFPKDSVYASRLDEVRAKVQGGFASGELERGKALLEQGKVDGARQVQVALAEKPFAASEARALERAIRDAVAAEEAERAREERAARVAEAPPPGPPPPAPRAERRRPRAERAKPRKPATSDAEYDELMNQAVRMVARGKRAQAVRALEKAHRLKPNDHLPHQRLCAIYPPLGQLEKALRHCKLWLGKEKTGAYKPQIRTRIQQLEEELNR